jgi:hypothetical protein
MSRTAANRSANNCARVALGNRFTKQARIYDNNVALLSSPLDDNDEDDDALVAVDINDEVRLIVGALPRDAGILATSNGNLDGAFNNKRSVPNDNVRTSTIVPRPNNRNKL